MQAIVLKRTDYRDNDQIITLLTSKSGKLSVLARGVKKITSKNSAYLEPFFLVEADILQGKEITYLTKAVGLKIFKNIRMDYDKLVLAQKAIFATDYILEEGLADLRIFNFLVLWLEFLDSNEISPGILVGYLIYLEKLLGFSPVMDRCLTCGKDTPKIIENNLAMYLSDGGIKCRECQNFHVTDKPVMLSPDDYRNWRKFLSSNIQNWPFVVSDNLKLNVKLFSDYHLGKKLEIF